MQILGTSNIHKCISIFFFSSNFHFLKKKPKTLAVHTVLEHAKAQLHSFPSSWNSDSTTANIPCCRFSLYDEAQLRRGLFKPEYTQVLNILLPTGMSFLENHKYFRQNTDLKEQSQDEWTPKINSFPSTMAWDYCCLHWCFKASFYL